MALKQENHEERWIVEAARGNMAAFEQLILLYEKSIYNICLRLLKKPEEAYDAAQEVCIKVWKQLKNFKGESKFSTWVYRIATNTCLDILRYKNRREEDPVAHIHEVQEKEHHSLLSNEWEDLSTYIAEQEWLEVLWQGILELKTEHRVMIVLRDIEGYSYEEIARYLKLSIGTVKSRLSRARMHLKKVLEQDKEPYRSFFYHIRR